MIKDIVHAKYGEIPVLTNDSKNKKMLLYFHGLDGSAAFSKPLFKSFSDYKIVAMESRGHNNSPIKASRFIHKHIQDYLDVIKYYKKQGYKIWVIGESMGAAYAVNIAYNYSHLVEGFFIWSVPNKLVNIMVGSKRQKFTIQFCTFFGYLLNINYKYSASVNYQKLSSNKVLHRLARIADRNKIRQTKESLATWAANKRAWRLIKGPREALTPIYYFQPQNDIIVNFKKVEAAFKKGNLKNKKFIPINNAKHILMYESEFNIVVDKIKKIVER